MVIALPRPTIWSIPGGDSPCLRATFSNDTVVEEVLFQVATDPDADEDDWTEVDTVAKPGTVTDPYVELIDTSRSQGDTHYYRARQQNVSGVQTQASAWSNVVRNDLATFFFDLRDASEFIREITLQADTANAGRGVTWFEAMAQMERSHRKTLELLQPRFTDAVIEEMYRYPPADVVELAKIEVYRQILLRAPVRAEDRREKLEILEEARRDAWRGFLDGSCVVLANGVVEFFLAPRVRAG